MDKNYIDRVLFDLECAINTLKKLKVGFTVKEFSNERQAEVLHTLNVLYSYLKSLK